MPGKRILLVDYDPRSLSRTREVLEGAGFNVSTCGDGLTAIDQFKSVSPDLVLLSAMLPKMHGFEVCSSIRKLPGGDKTPVVIITDVYKGKRYRVDAINKYGATEYIEKPIEDANLVNTLQGLVKENGRTADQSLEIDDRTVQFSRELLSQAVREVPIGGSSAPSEKKAVTEKPRSKDDISKKIEESLAGLDLEVGRKIARPKPKSAEPTVVIPTVAGPASTGSAPAKEDSDGVFTSEDLFTDVIASVERELQSEKIISVPDANPGSEVASSTIQIAPSVPLAPVLTKPPQTDVSKPAEPAVAKAAEVVKSAAPAAPESAKKSGRLGLELEKKLSSTLSGLKKDAGRPASAKASAQAKPTAASVAAPKPGAPPKVEVKPVAPALPAAEKEITQEGINFGQYLLLSKIATGGMAELFKAKRKGVEGFEKILAIKRILPHMSDNEEFVTMFIDEAKLAAQLTHHNICQIFDLGKIENSYYIAMEYVHGKDLRATMKAARSKNKPVPVELAILIVSKVASALDYAHRKRGPNGQPLNLVHRDVSPQNILLSYEGEVKLVDFGIAKAATKVHQTQHGALKGKLLYMSPEQAWGRAVDKRSDVFSLGVVLYELLTGRPLFFDENDTEVTILDKVREAKVPPVREFNSRVSQDLERIITKALRRNPDERYQVALDMQKDLDNLFYTEGYNATSGTLADFIRSLFPEEQETVEKEAKPVSVPAPSPAPQPVAATPAVEQPAPAPERKAEKWPAPPPVEEKRPEAKAPVGAVAEAPATLVTPSGFRDISSPEIMPQPEGSRFPVKTIGIAALLLVAVLGAVFFIFRGGSEEQTPPAQTQTPVAQTQKPPTTTPAPPQPAVSQPAQKPQPAVVTPANKAEEQNTKEEEQKKLAEQKAAEEQKKQEADRKKQEQAKLEEDQKKAAEQQQQEKAQEQAAPPAPAPEETKVAEVQQPPQQPPVQEPPKREPVATEQPKQTAKPVEPPKPTLKDGDLVDLTPDVTKPELLSRGNAVYPPAAQKKRLEATVILSALISENGSVADVKILRSGGGSTGFDDAARTAVRKWKFRPAVKDGKRVKVWVTYPIVFKLQ